MSNGTVYLAKALFLIACIAMSAGCDAGARSEEKQAALPEMRYRVDQARNRIWVLTGDGVHLYDVAGQKSTAIALPEWVRVAKTYGCLPDLALGRNGEAVVTSNVIPTLWRIDPESLAVTMHALVLDADADKEVGFSGLVYSAEQGAFFAVSYMHGSLWRIDPLFRRAQKIELSEPIHAGCDLAVRPRVVQQSIRRFGGLCVRTARELWEVEFAPSQRSAFVRARVRADAGYEPCGAH